MGGRRQKPRGRQRVEHLFGALEPQRFVAVQRLADQRGEGAGRSGTRVRMSGASAVQMATMICS